MKEKITFIGNGNMALSIAQGLKNEFDIEVIGRDIKKLYKFENELGVEVEKTLYSYSTINNKVIILCIKPNNLEEVGHNLKGTAKELYSVLAGVKLSKLDSNIHSLSIVRVMPNLSASVGESMTTMTGDIKLKKDKENTTIVLDV